MVPNKLFSLVLKTKFLVSQFKYEVRITFHFSARNQTYQMKNIKCNKSNQVKNISLKLMCLTDRRICLKPCGSASNAVEKWPVLYVFIKLRCAESVCRTMDFVSAGKNKLMLL